MKRAPGGEFEDDGRFRDAHGDDAGPEAETGYRRRPRPVRVQRRPAADWLGGLRRHWRAGLGTAAGLLILFGLYRLFFASAWFVLANSEQIAVRASGPADAAQLTASVRAIFAADLGRNIFFIPLDARRASLEALPWVGRAAVLRLWPARLQVAIGERAPVAFARVGGGDATLDLVDAGGVLLPPPRGGSFDFPVLSGLAGAASASPDAPAWREKRAPQMAQYAAFSAAVGPTGAGFSEINLSRPGDLAARYLSSPGHTLLVHFGDRNFAPRYALFRQQIATWQAKYPQLAAVDLRFDGEAIVDPGTPPPAPAPKPGIKSAAKPAGKTAAPRRGHSR